MNIIEREPIKSVILSAELIMYGHLSIKIENEDDGINVKWTSITDGGKIITDNEKRISKKQVKVLVNILHDINVDDFDDESGNICWTLQFIDYLDNDVIIVEPGYWRQELLETIITTFNKFLEDDEVLVDFHNWLI